MDKRRGKKLIRIIETVAVSLVVLDLAFYFVLVRPLRGRRTAAETQYTVARGRVRQAKARVARLEQFRARVPDAEAQLQSFLDEHVPARRQGYSRAMRTVFRMAENSKVRLVNIQYKHPDGESDPLPHVGLEFEVAGPFSNLLRFSHELETSKEFLALRDFSFEAGETFTIAMHVGADLYLRP